MLMILILNSCIIKYDNLYSAMARALWGLENENETIDKIACPKGIIYNSEGIINWLDEKGW